MTTLIKFVLSFLTIFLATLVSGQSYTATVQDAASGEPIPFATVQLAKNKGTITNEEGIFSIDIAQLNMVTDSVYISSMGYEKVAILPLKEMDTIIKLPIKRNELENVFLTNNPLEVEDIIDRIKDNLETNYPNTLTQKKIFFRQSLSAKADKMDIEVEESTIPEFDQAFMDDFIQSVPKESRFYSESVGTLSGNYTKQKLFIEKAAKLYDKEKTGVGVSAFSKRFQEIVEQRVKPDSYFKVKSGLIGTTIELDSSKVGDSESGLKIKVDTDEDPTQENITLSVKGDLNELYAAMFFKEDTALDFLAKSNRYAFTKRTFTTIGDALVYVIDFEPKRKKDFKGTLYVNTEDYAVVRLEYQNVRKLSSFGLFGIRYSEHLYKGKSLYAKDENGGYTLRYMELEKGLTFGLDRPLKIIEKNKNVKGRRKQNEVAMELEIASSLYDKREFVVFDSAVIDEASYEAATESEDVEATHLTAYDPTFWEGYTIIEPNAAIQRFKVGE